MFKEARKLGDRLVVFLNSDEWLERKKGYCFMKYAERAEIIRAFRAVDHVIKANDDDDTVIQDLAEWTPSVFVNSGDRPINTLPEASICHELNIALIYLDVGAAHAHSSDIIKEACTKMRGPHVRPS